MNEVLLREVSFLYSKSSGSGGQKVNKTNSRVTLTWDIEASQVLNEEEKLRFRKLFAKRISSQNLVIIHRQSHRSSQKNRKACVSALEHMITKAKETPKTRKATKPTKASKEKRLQNKRSQKEKKQSRKKVSH